jgi:putative colanic acid biosynthesis UDP-glucose lipid carrier transferase
VWVNGMLGEGQNDSAPFAYRPKRGTGKRFIVHRQDKGSGYVNSFQKRLTDIVIASLLLGFLLPALFIISVAILLTDKGPVLYRQLRGGKGHTKFTIFKFRTMQVASGHPGTEVTQATRDDPRITAVGSFLRRNSLDELPQLLNVIRGDMSLVGPRPHAVSHDAFYSTILPDYQLRFAAKPGITGLAQIQGFRGETKMLGDMEQRIAEDLKYIETASWFGDLVILIRTLSRVFVDENAY